MIRLVLFLGLLSLNAQALQLLQPIEGQNIVKQKPKFTKQIPLNTKLLTQLKINAKSGDASAQLSLAKMYHHGINLAKDEKLAFYWYFQAAEAGYASAQFNLAEFYQNSMGMKKDLKQAIFWYKKSAQQDFVNAQYKLATMYHYGSGVSIDYKQAHYWYKRAAKLGFLPAQLELAKFYEKGKGVEKNQILAQHWYEIAALRSNAEAQYHLALLLERQGKTFQALLMYQQSAKQKFTKAQLRLAQTYYEGILDKKNDTKALKLALAVAQKGDKNAQFLVARIYHASTQIQRDLVKAKYWYNKALKQGHRLAASFLKQLNARVIINQETTAQASSKPFQTTTLAPDIETIRRSLQENKTTLNKNIEKLTTSANQGNPAAQHELSLLFSAGTLIPKDEKKAFLLMQKAATQGLAKSQNFLAIMYLQGIGVKSDKKLATFWAKSSARQGNQTGKNIQLYIKNIKKDSDTTQYE